MNDTIIVANHVDGNRLWSRLMGSCKLWRDSEGGRQQARTVAGRNCCAGEARRLGPKIGLSPSVDAASNLFLRLNGSDSADLPPL